MKAGVVIVGSGLSGYSVAKAFREADTTTPLTIFSSQEAHYYSKPLLSTALTQKRTPEALPMASTADMEAKLFAKIYAKTTVTAIDSVNHTLQLDTGESYPYAQLVLAVGANAIQPKLQGNALGNVHSVNNLEAYAHFRDTIETKKTITILGSGLVGCEFANDLSNAGYKVSVISPEGYPLAALVPEPIGRAVQAALQGVGVQWHLNRLAVSVNAAEGHYRVRLADGSFLTPEVVLSAVGIRPNITLAKQAGLAINQGIVVNEYLETSQPHIYAIGDCAEVLGQVYLYVAPLLHCANVLGKNLAGGRATVHYPLMPIVIKTPACPVVVLPPPKGLSVEWKIEGDNTHLKALCYSKEGRLIGFALSGQKTQEKMQLIKKMTECVG
ncbi:MAG TPA: FAD-dependent oxidoreductase [Coxiellaceae bacterium]|nr:FAD-dependent oxidoreductase [Coxiellaceae bacterium]